MGNTINCLSSNRDAPNPSRCCSCFSLCVANYPKESYGPDKDIRDVPKSFSDDTLDEKKRKSSTFEMDILGIIEDVPTDLSELGKGSPLPLPPLKPDDIGKKSLVLDMDRTILFRSSKKEEVPLISFATNIYSATRSKEIEVYVSIRPGLSEFLEAISPYYEIIIFTRSSKELANPILDMVDPKGYVTHRLFINSCIKEQGGRIIKDLSLLGRDLSEVVIVDDNSNVFQRQVANAIECYPYFGNCDWDKELDQIARILLEVKDVKDVREHLSSLRQKYPTWI